MRLGVSCRFLKRVGAVWEGSWTDLGHPWTFSFFETSKRLGSDITFTVHFEVMRSRLRGKCILILEMQRKSN